MKKCDTCNVEVSKQHENCPLCGLYLGEKESSFTEYPKYQKKKTKSHFAYQLLLFLSIACSGICMLINWMNFYVVKQYWSVPVVSSIFFSFFLVTNIVSQKKNLSEKFFRLYGIILIYTVILDFYFGWERWSISFVIPFLTIALMILYGALLIGRKDCFAEYFGFLLITIGISILQLLLIFFSLTIEIWPIFSSILFGVLVLIGILIFSKGKFRREWKKRFHTD